MPLAKSMRSATRHLAFGALEGPWTVPAGRVSGPPSWAWSNLDTDRHVEEETMVPP